VKYYQFFLSVLRRHFVDTYTGHSLLKSRYIRRKFFLAGSATPHADSTTSNEQQYEQRDLVKVCAGKAKQRVGVGVNIRTHYNTTRALAFQ